jgi:hypothetical protein
LFSRHRAAETRTPRKAVCVFATFCYCVSDIPAHILIVSHLHISVNSDEAFDLRKASSSNGFGEFQFDAPMPRIVTFGP